MALIESIEIFALVSGVAYVVLEIFQKNAMWILGIATGVACAYSFGMQKLWASMVLNVYYVGMSAWGLWQWRMASRRLTEENARQESQADIHLGLLNKATSIGSCLVFCIGVAALGFIMAKTGDPHPALDANVTMMSVVATWWLAKSVPYQWFIWIVADILSMMLCLTSGMYWMAALYLIYSASAVYGWHHWTTKGKYIDA